MTPTAPALFARDFSPSAARDLAVVADDRQEAAMIQLEAEVSAAARRLRDAHRASAAAPAPPEHARPPIDGARARVILNVPEPSTHQDMRQAASDADRMQRHQQLAARGAALLAAIEAARPETTTVEAPAPNQSIFNR